MHIMLYVEGKFIALNACTGERRKSDYQLPKYSSQEFRKGKELEVIKLDEIIKRRVKIKQKQTYNRKKSTKPKVKSVERMMQLQKTSTNIDQRETRYKSPT